MFLENIFASKVEYSELLSLTKQLEAKKSQR
jgi:hypothetical protein